MPHCCAFGCKNTGSNVVMHSFPNPNRFPERFHSWLNLLGGKFKTLSDYEIYIKKRVCDIHFIDSHRNRYKRLNALAMPTLCLPGDIGSITKGANSGISGSEPTLPSVKPQRNDTGEPNHIPSSTAVILEHNYCAISRNSILSKVRLEMKAFTVILCVGTLSVVSSAPINQKNPQQRSEYDYEYESSKPNQARDPAESASHYDAYIQDVQSAASGGNNAKKGFSQGSGLRTIAVGSANQAKTALGNQQAAAYQAAYVAKNTLAQSAAQSSATAQAALAGKQVILSGLEQQVRDAKVGLQGEEMQLQQAKRAAQAAAQAAQQAMHQVNVIQAALNAAQATSENANEAASQAAGELGAQTAMVGAARQRLQTLQEQLKGVRIDFEATQAAARKAQAAAQQAQANAAEAAAKAAAAGLGSHDASHEESGPTQPQESKPLQILDEYQENAAKTNKTDLPYYLSYSKTPPIPTSRPQIEYHVVNSKPLKLTKSQLIPFMNYERKGTFPTFIKSGGTFTNSGYMFSPGVEFRYKW